MEASRPPEVVDAVCQTDESCWPPPQVAPQSVAATQTSKKCHAWREDDLVIFLVRYEHLLVQEEACVEQRIDHEPALHFARRYLSGLEPLPTTLPTSRPPRNVPAFEEHTLEDPWIHYPEPKKKGKK